MSESRWGKADFLRFIDVGDGVCQMGGGSARTQQIGQRLTLVGTIHVDPESAALVRDTILGLGPEAVALEIDQSRLYALQHPGMARVSVAPGVSFLAMVLVEKFAGQLTGSAAGAEMLYAIEAARQVGARVELVDAPIQSTIGGLRGLPLKERARLLLDSVASLILLPFGRPDFRDLTEGLDEQLQMFRVRYPNLSRLLLDSREEYMANRIRSVLDATTGRVVAVIGLGHMASLGKRLAGYTERQSFSTTVSWTVTPETHGS